MTRTLEQLADSVNIVGNVRNAQRGVILSIIKKRAAAHRAKKKSILSSLLADELEDLVQEITAATKSA